MIALIENQTITGIWSNLDCVPRDVDKAKLCDTGDADVTPGERVSLYTQSWQRKTPAQLAAEGLDENGEKLPTAAEINAQAHKEVKIAKQRRKIELLQKLVALNSNYDANWQLKDAGQWAALGFDENGEKLPTAVEIKAKADKEAKIAKQKRKVELLQKLVALNEGYEANNLVPIADQVAASKRDIAKTIRQQRIELEKAKIGVLAKLRKADAKAVAKAQNNAKKYKTLLQSAEKELKKLES